MTTEEKLDQLTDQVLVLVRVVTAHENSIQVHSNSMQDIDYRLGRLVEFAENLNKSFARLEIQWQAYINTLPKQ